MILKRHRFILTGIFLFIGPPLLTLKFWESWVKEKMTTKTHWFKNAMRVYVAELMCSTGVSGFQTFKPVFCICNKLRLHAEMLSLWVTDVIFPRSNPLMSYPSVLNVSNGGPSNTKLTLKINSLRIKRKAQNFASWMLSEYAFKIERKKGNDFLIIVPL